MGFLTRMSHSLLALLLCMAAGGVAGIYAPAVGDVAYTAAQVYLSIVSMAAIPLLVVATFFGLRQTMGLPFPARRIAMIAGLALLLVASCAATGLALGWVNSPGAHLDADLREHLGELVQKAGDGGDMEMRLYDNGVQATPVERPRATLLPDNFFRALVEGRSLGILSCALLFGLAFAALARTQHNALNHMFEGIYRTLELIIARANILLPVVAFGMSAHVFSETDAVTIRAMLGFLLHFVVLVALLGMAAIAVIHRRGNQPLVEVLQHLKTPMLVSLVSSSTTASIPHTIEAMSARLCVPARGLGALLRAARAVRGQPVRPHAERGRHRNDRHRRHGGRLCFGRQQQPDQRGLRGHRAVAAAVAHRGGARALPGHRPDLRRPAQPAHAAGELCADRHRLGRPAL